MSQNSSDSRYLGEEKIVMAIDLGTTQGAVSYAYLCPNEKTEPKMVIRWPGQPEAIGDSKIPSLVAYKDNELAACGAEAVDLEDDPEYEIAKWFKLHLHPETMKIQPALSPAKPEEMQSRIPPVASSSSAPKPVKRKHSDIVKQEDVPADAARANDAEFSIPPLPRQATLQRVYVDFLGYMFNHFRQYFRSTLGGERIWDRLHDQISVILAIPNGWENDQQAFLRQAAIKAGLVSDRNADLLLQFVTEGEASIHYTLAHSPSKEWIAPGLKFAVMDAGGSTVDTTLYVCQQVKPTLALKEVRASECVQAGGVFIDRSARAFLDAKLRDSKFGDDDTLKAMVQEFEKKTKRIFDGSQGTNVIHFGRGGDNDRASGIIKGRLSLTSDEVRGIFDSATTRILQSCERLVKGHAVKYLLVVGGFGESPYLRSRLKSTLERSQISVITVEEPSKKAAAEGAVLWSIKQLVAARAARFTVGTALIRPYDQNNSQHWERVHKIYISPDGTPKISGFFEGWIQKDQVMDSTFSQTFFYCREYTSMPQDLGNFTLEIYAWDGAKEPRWCLDEQGFAVPGMRVLGQLSANLSRLRSALRGQRGISGRVFWKVDFQVTVLFGGTSLQAKLKWTEGTRLCEGPITILPNSSY